MERGIPITFDMRENVREESLIFISHYASFRNDRRPLLDKRSRCTEFKKVLFRLRSREFASNLRSHNSLHELDIQ